MNRIGLIIYRKEVKEDFNKVLDELLVRYTKEKLTRRNTLFGHCNENKGWIIFQISNKAFKTYSIFDNFLLEFAEKTRDNNYILVCGHNDDRGFMWMDYFQQEDFLKFITKNEPNPTQSTKETLEDTSCKSD